MKDCCLMDGSSYADCGLILSWWLLGVDLVEATVQGLLLLKDNHSSIRVSTWTILKYNHKINFMHDFPFQ
jgi:hypothetical protein